MSTDLVHCDAAGCSRSTTNLALWFEVDLQVPTDAGSRLVIGAECCSWRHLLAVVAEAGASGNYVVDEAVAL